MEFCSMVRSARKKKFRNAKQFYKEAKLSCTYCYYAKVEQNKLPNGPLAAEIAKKLGINLREALFAWARDHMIDALDKSQFTDAEFQASAPKIEEMPMKKSLEITRLQANLLKQDPIYFELAMYIFCNHGRKFVSIKDISSVFGISEDRTKHLLDDLYDYSIIEQAGEDQFTSKEWLHIPSDSKFDYLREMNFERAIKQLFKTPPEKRMTWTINRHFTFPQVKLAQTYLFHIIDNITSMTDMPADPEARIYTFGMLFSERQFGDG